MNPCLIASPHKKISSWVNLLVPWEYLMESFLQIFLMVNMRNLMRGEWLLDVLPLTTGSHDLTIRLLMMNMWHLMVRPSYISCVGSARRYLFGIRDLLTVRFSHGGGGQQTIVHEISLGTMIFTHGEIFSWGGTNRQGSMRYLLVLWDLLMVRSSCERGGY